MHTSNRSAAHRSLLALVVALAALPACDAPDDGVRRDESDVVAGPAVVAAPAVCVSSFECAAGAYCTTESGVCNAGPGDTDVCRGTCAPRP